jgi:hypothetical protein
MLADTSRYLYCTAQKVNVGFCTAISADYQGLRVNALAIALP